LGTLNAQQADILRLFASEQNDGIISAAHESGQTVYFWIDRSACSINCSILDDQLCYDVVISISCSIADAAGVPIEEIGTDILKKELHGQLTELITLSQQKLGGAFLGFEDAARKSDYQWYSTHSEDFAEYYRSAVIKLDITCQPERSGVFN